MKNLLNAYSDKIKAFGTKIKDYVKHNTVVRITSIGLVSLIVSTQLIGPLSAIASGLSSQLGTNTALGSPLLDDNFNYTQWDKWELLAFGVFLSNFANPLVDSYKTAFTVNNEGSAGAGKKALEFGDGSDSTGTKALIAMLDYVVKNQSSAAGKPIKVIYSKLENGNVTDETLKDATINDILCMDKNTTGSAYDTLNSKGCGSIKKDNSAGGKLENYKIPKITEYRLARLVVNGDSQGQYETVFDWKDGWDAQMISATFASVAFGKYTDKASANLKTMMDNNSPLMLDAFGNICCTCNGQNIVVFPSAANSHIYSTPKYNLLTSMILSDSYLSLGSGAVKSSLEAEKDGNDNLLGANFKVDKKYVSNNIINKGEILVYFDTDYAIEELIASNSTVDFSTVNPAWGKQIIRLINSDINKNTSDCFGVRVSVLGANALDANNTELLGVTKHMANSADMVNIFSPVKNGRDTLTAITTEKGKASLFGSTMYSAISSDTDGLKAVQELKERGKNTFTRWFMYDTLKYLDGTFPAFSSSLGLKSANTLRGELMQKDKVDDVARFLWFENYDPNKSEMEQKVSKLALNSIIGYGQILIHKSSQSFIDNVKKVGFDKTWQDASGVSLNKGNLVDADWGSKFKSVQRIIKVYARNDTMKKAMDILGVQEGTEFSLWTPRIYLTYLQWCGVLDGKNQFNTHLFSESSDLLNKSAEDLFSGTFLTEEEKKAEIMNYTYLMLHPADGRDYRATVLKNWFTDWVYNTYKNIVFGNSITDYSGKIGTRSASGFLHMQNYEDNFMTSWFIKGYAKYAIILIGVFLIAIVVVGVLNQKKAAWFIISIIITINVILITPSSGEITPYVANNLVQKMFSSKMTYWAMAESIANAKIEKQAIRGNNGSTADTELALDDYVRMFNVAYLDRSIMLKHDISKKITEDSTGLINQVQSFVSTRWLLPTLIRQFSADDNSANYVYQSLGDIYDNWSNMYWVYNYDDINFVNTANSVSIQEVDASQKNGLDAASKQQMYDNYTSISPGTSSTTIALSDYMTYSTQSTSRLEDDSSVSHAGFYLLKGIGQVPNIQDYDGKWYGDGGYMTGAIGKMNADDFIATTETLETLASSYDPTKVGAKAEFGYLWTTENPGNYFYQVVKDTFGSSETLPNLISDLQGYFKESTTTGDKERVSFMHYRDSGDVRDILDLEELVTNVIPYMYSVQTIACGTDGTDGILGDTKMSTYELYKNNYKSWLYRCNWVTKLMEDKDLTRPCKIGYKGSDGKRHTKIVKNPMLAYMYNEGEGRKMIFSEAEKNAQGLSDADLSYVELKLIKINNAVEKDWTMLINYANTSDLTTEVMYRQMATDALLEFNKELSPDRLINGSKALYPTALDLRSISFDSVMKMLMLSSTRDTSYVYGDTMKNVIENSDIFSAIALLITSILCSAIIPFIRNIVLGLIFYTYLYTAICNILAGGSTKLKITTAFGINNTVYLVVTLLYYAVFMLLINTSTADSVLSVNNIVIDAGPPIWQFLLIIIISCGYIYASFMLINFTIKNFRDMGFEVYASWSRVLAGKIGDKISGLKSHFGGGSSNSTSSVGGSSKKSVSKETSSGPMVEDSSTTSNTISNETVNNNTNSSNNSESTENIENESSGYQMDDIEGNENSNSGENFYDKESEKGRQMNEEEKQDEEGE